MKIAAQFCLSSRGSVENRFVHVCGDLFGRLGTMKIWGEICRPSRAVLVLLGAMKIVSQRGNEKISTTKILRELQLAPDQHAVLVLVEQLEGGVDELLLLGVIPVVREESFLGPHNP